MVILSAVRQAAQCSRPAGSNPSACALREAVLANRGGFTPGLALARGTAAIDAGTNTGCPSTDQRGETRPFDGDDDQIPICDVGAFEVTGKIFSDGFEPPGL